MKPLIIAGLLALSVHAADLEWKQGKVTEIGNRNAPGHPARGIGVTYTIQADNFVYIAAEVMAHNRLKEEQLNIDDPVKFALKGETKIVLLGKDGKEHTLELLKRTRRFTPNEDIPLASPK
ncbi:MAG: hypothetical protein M3Z09_16475 [Acidobacteriota bacterium]|nr:hypothetical protein [Acidobacteriota bacterium]